MDQMNPLGLYQRRKIPGQRRSRMRWKIKAKYGFRCAFCGSRDDDLTIDHIRPKCAGGNLANGGGRPLCARCHRARHEAEFIAKPGMPWVTRLILALHVAKGRRHSTAMNMVCRIAGGWARLWRRLEAA